MIYLDNGATTYPKPECVYEALNFANRNLAFNAGRGSYKKSKEVSEMIYDTRCKIASFVNKDADSVVFLSSATECLNLLINGIDFQDGDTVYISPFEHNAIVRPLYNIKKSININIIILPFDKKTWNPDFKKIDEMFSIKKPKAVLLSQISNVTGFVVDYLNIFKLSKAYGSINILDSAQAYGIANPDLENCDFCVFAGHKTLYASFGIAGFIINSTYNLNITKSGGNGSDSLNHYMPSKGFGKYESGSPNSVAIYGLNKSIDWLKTNNPYKHEKELTYYLIEKLSKIDKVKLYIPESKDILGIVSFNVKGYLSDDVASILNEEFEIEVRSGFHCAPFVHEFIGSLDTKGTVRVSVGAFNSKNDIDVLINAILTL